MPLSVTRVGLHAYKLEIYLFFLHGLQHHVNAFKSDVERISVSGNLNFKTVDLAQLEKLHDKI